MNQLNVLFVCMGNICRSPTGQGVFEKKLQDAGIEHRVFVDSAGTHAYHIGESPDRRSSMAALKRGIDLSSQRARKVELIDFENFDYVLAMDRSNLSDLLSICPQQHQHKVKLFLSYATEVQEQDVPDPYYGGGQGFEHVLDLVEAAAEGLLEDVQTRL